MSYNKENERVECEYKHRSIKNVQGRDRNGKNEEK
jgi:hypothetical protein